MAEIPTLTKRRLQAQVIGPIYFEMVAAIGEEKASAILDAAIRKAAVAEGQEFAKRTKGGRASEIRFRHHALPRCRDLRGDGPRQDRTPSLMQSRRHLLPGLRPQHHARAQADIMQGGPSCTFRYRYVAKTG